MAFPDAAIKSNRLPDSPLVGKYRSLLDAYQAGKTTVHEDVEHAVLVLDLIHGGREVSARDRRVGFLFSVERIELLSQSLINETVQV